MSRRLLSLPSVGSRWFSLALLAATVLMVLAVLAGAAGAADAGSPSEQRKFKTQFQGKFDTSALASGVQVPAGAGFGETIVVAHKCDFSFFTVGTSASAGVQALAEGGSTSDFQAEVTAAVAAGNAQASWTIDSPNSPTGNKNGPNSVPVEDEFSCLTILVKINPTSDWFAGVSAYDLRSRRHLAHTRQQQQHLHRPVPVRRRHPGRHGVCDQHHGNITAGHNRKFAQ